jgi:uncharacterized membrane protein
MSRRRLVPLKSASVRDRREGGDQDHQEGPRGPVKSSHIITESMEVGVPARVAYDRSLQYDHWQEMFKKESAQKGGRNKGVKVSSKIGPSQRQWSTEVTETNPGHRIDWRSRGGLQASGTTTFHRIDDRLTRVMVQIEYHPSGFMESVGNFLRMQRRRVRKDLRLFKNHVELHGGENPEESK